MGNLTSSPKYDVYGGVRSNGGTASSRQGFVGGAGHVSDDTGLIYMKARYYDPSAGRFNSEDPGFNGPNWYVYCDNSPVTMVDADGKKPWPVFSQDAWAIGMGLAMFAACVAICTRPQDKVAAYIGTPLATLAVAAFSYASLGLLSPDMNQVMTNLKTIATLIAIMVGGLQLGGRSSLPGVAIAATAAFVYGLALAGALAANDYDTG
jgi:RHS repeat-associated protein